MSDDNKPVYDQPATFVNLKRVRGLTKNKVTGVTEVTEQDSKKRAKINLTFGLGTDRQGNPNNGADQLIEALLPYQGKQVNFTIYVEEKTSSQGRVFPSAFVKITEMIPRDEAPMGMKTQFVAKTTTRAQDVKNRAEEIKKSFSGTKA